MSEPKIIDLRGLQCPTPLVRLNEEVVNFDIGEEFHALANDRAFELDVQAWCEMTGNVLVSIETSAENEITAAIRRS